MDIKVKKLPRFLTLKPVFNALDIREYVFREKLEHVTNEWFICSFIKNHIYYLSLNKLNLIISNHFSHKEFEKRQGK